MFLLYTEQLRPLSQHVHAQAASYKHGIRLLVSLFGHQINDHGPNPSRLNRNSRSSPMPACVALRMLTKPKPMHSPVPMNPRKCTAIPPAIPLPMSQLLF